MRRLALLALPLASAALGVACFGSSSAEPDAADDGSSPEPTIDASTAGDSTVPDAYVADAYVLDSHVLDSAVDAGPAVEASISIDAADAGSVDADAGPEASPDVAAPYATCAAIHAATPAAVDGLFTLYVGGDPAMPWDVYCANMSTTPVEYLPLVQTGAASNFSQYTAGGDATGTNVRTSYTQVRIDPVTLLVDTTDQTFATSTGMLLHPPSGPEVTSMPYAEAMDCVAVGSLTGVGNVDLRGTPFSVAPGAFTYPPGGVSSVGVATYGNGNQTVDLAGGGYCGWISPAPLVDPPYNTAGGTLPLAYGLAGDGGVPADAASDE